MLKDRITGSKALMRALQAEWKTVGAVARKYSDELWNQFSEAGDAFFNARRDAAKERREERHNQRAARSTQAGSNLSIYRVRDNLMQEIKVAENNILFFTAKSKTANKLVADMQRKIDGLRAKLEEVKQQIKEQEE